MHKQHITNQIGRGLDFKLGILLMILPAILNFSCARSSTSSGQREISYPAKVGTSNGGGGKGVRCGKNVRLLDLYEAGTLLPGLSTYEENIIKFGASLAQALRTPDPDDHAASGPEILQGLKESFDSKIVYLSDGQTLPLTADATLPPIAGECTIVQIAIWATDGHIYIDSNLWNSLDAQNKSALALHEVIYRDARESGAKKSDEVRAIIGEVFTSASPVGRFSQVLLKKEHVWCGAGSDETKGSVFELYAIDERRDSVDGVGVYFHAVAGEYMLSKTDTFLPGVKMHDLLDGQFSSEGDINNLRRKLKWRFELKKDNRGEETLVRAWLPGQARPNFSRGFCRLESL